MNIMLIKWKIKKYHTVGIVLKSNIKIIEREETDILNTQIHDLVLTLLGTRTEIKSGGVLFIYILFSVMLAISMCFYTFCNRVSFTMLTRIVIKT